MCQDYDQQEEQRYQQQQLQDIFDGEIDVNDPHLAAVFPDFAASFAQDEERATDEEMYDSLDFVDHSDFAVLNRDGHVEDYGGWEKLEETVEVVVMAKMEKMEEMTGVVEVVIMAEKEKMENRDFRASKVIME